MNLLKELEASDFFKYVEDENQLQFALQTMEENLESEKSIYFPCKSFYYSEALKQNWYGPDKLDFRSCNVYPVNLYRGGLTDCLTSIKELFVKRNLMFDFENEYLGSKLGSKSYIKHEIDINNKRYTIADGDFDRADGSWHYCHQVEKIMNEQLLLQGSTERVYKIISNVSEDLWYIMMENEHFEIFKRNKKEFSASRLYIPETLKES
jgi:hypothetical protein